MMASDTTTGTTQTATESFGFGPTLIRRHGAGPRTLFLHGAHFPTAWLPFHDALAERTSLTAPVHPGYESGVVPDWLRSVDDYAMHYRELLGDGAHLVGYDLGAWIAATLAAYYPDRVRSFTAVCPYGLRMPDAPPLEFLGCDPTRYEAALFNGPAGDHAPLLGNRREPAGFAELYGQNSVTARLIWERHYDVRLAHRLALVTAPALVIGAKDDRLTSPAHAHGWAALLPSARLVMIDHAGHAAVVTHPASVASEILACIKEVER